jgi:hypothetical protein
MLMSPANHLHELRMKSRLAAQKFQQWNLAFFKEAQILVEIVQRDVLSHRASLRIRKINS